MGIITGIGAGLAGLGSLAGMITGGIQTRRGRRDLEQAYADRPTYTIPSEVREQENIARMRASNPFLPGQQLMEQQIDQQGARTAQNIQEMGNVSDLYAVQMQQNQARNQLSMQSAQQALQNELRLLQQLSTSADYQDKAFDVNEFMPFQERRMDALARIGAGTTNLAQSLNTLSTMGASMIGIDDPERNRQKRNRNRGVGGGFPTVDIGEERPNFA